MTKRNPIILITLFLFAALAPGAMACADEVAVTEPLYFGETSTTATITSAIALAVPSWNVSISEDGQLSINGTPVERMSDPEIKEAMKEIVGYVKAERADRWLIDQYDRQTGYLLRELERCGERKESLERINRELFGIVKKYENIVSASRVGIADVMREIKKEKKKFSKQLEGKESK
jgi:hypothetical protein